MVITISSRTAHGQTRMTVDYGPAFQGVRHADFEVTARNSSARSTGMTSRRSRSSRRTTPRST